MFSGRCLCWGILWTLEPGTWYVRTRWYRGYHSEARAAPPGTANAQTVRADYGVNSSGVSQVGYMLTMSTLQSTTAVSGAWYM